MKKFQFLIGSLKALKWLGEKVVLGLFQFLIGSLKAEGADLAFIEKNMFQFLIGSLKARIIWTESHRCKEVSIPHR